MTEQLSLFDDDVLDDAWKNDWQAMPDFSGESREPYYTLKVHFSNAEDIQRFAKLIEQKVTGPKREQRQTHSLWWPEAEIERYSDKRYIGVPAMNPIYPIYIPSRGRWESRLTAKALDALGVPYRIVIQEAEYEQYAAVIDPAKILVLDYEGKGLVEARNWIRQHSMDEGHERHWQLDDNIRAFYRFNNNLKVPVTSGNIFRAAEDFVDRYTNVKIAGFQYFMFISRKTKCAPFRFNARVYSISLIQNDLEHWWRGVYNDDTDLCLRTLKDGDCTCLFNAFLAEKATTMTVSGGLTDSHYKIEDGRYKMAESLREQHPDIVTNTRKWGRWQHRVDYSGFKNNRPIPRAGAPTADEVNNYGMRLEAFDGSKTGDQ